MTASVHWHLFFCFIHSFLKHLLWTRKKRTAAEVRAMTEEKPRMLVTAEKMNSPGGLAKVIGKRVVATGTKGMIQTMDPNGIQRRKEPTAFKQINPCKSIARVDQNLLNIIT
jgi:hypothetical protein